jgi:hypothetical protein
MALALVDIRVNLLAWLRDLSIYEMRGSKKDTARKSEAKLVVFASSI